MIRFKVYLCNNEDCLKYFRRSQQRFGGCKAKEFCSVECCIEDVIDQEGTLDDYSGCDNCLGGETGSWVFVDHISEMCGEPAWQTLDCIKEIA